VGQESIPDDDEGERIAQKNLLQPEFFTHLLLRLMLAMTRCILVQKPIKYISKQASEN